MVAIGCCDKQPQGLRPFRRTASARYLRRVQRRSTTLEYGYARARQALRSSCTPPDAGLRMADRLVSRRKFRLAGSAASVGWAQVENSCERFAGDRNLEMTVGRSIYIPAIDHLVGPVVRTTRARSPWRRRSRAITLDQGHHPERRVRWAPLEHDRIECSVNVALRTDAVLRLQISMSSHTSCIPTISTFGHGMARMRGVPLQSPEAFAGLPRLRPVSVPAPSAGDGDGARLACRPGTSGIQPRGALPAQYRSDAVIVAVLEICSPQQVIARRRCCAARLKNAGFVRTGTKTANLVKAGLWVRPLEPPVGRAHRLLIGVEGDRYGWSPQFGGGFRVLFGAGESTYDWPGLTREQDAEARRLNHSILDRLNPYYQQPIATMRELVDRRGVGQFWFHFITEEDVRHWLDLLGGWLPHSLAHLGKDPGISRLFPDRA